MAEAAAGGGFNLNPALRNFFTFNANAQTGDAEQAITAPLLGSVQAGSGAAPPLLFPDMQPPKTFPEKVKNVLLIFAVFFALGVIGAILVHSMAVIMVVTVVVLFIVVQVLTASGTMAVNWANVRAALLRRVDRDGDGTFSWSDFKGYCMDFFSFVAAKGVPAISGLILGALVGWNFS